jgi:hypothetical protein
MSKTTFFVNTEGQADKRSKGGQTCHIMATLAERIQQGLGIRAVHIKVRRVQLIVQPAEFHALADVHSPIQVQYYLEHRWEDFRPPGPSDG